MKQIESDFPDSNFDGEIEEEKALLVDKQSEGSFIPNNSRFGDWPVAYDIEMECAFSVVDSANLTLEQLESELAVGQLMRYDVAAYALYCKYASKSGFCARIGEEVKSRDGTCFVAKSFLCFRGDFTDPKVSEKRIPNDPLKLFQCGCNAKLRIARMKDEEMWMVTDFDKEHNHELYPSDVGSARGLSKDNVVLSDNMGKSRISKNRDGDDCENGRMVNVRESTFVDEMSFVIGTTKKWHELAVRASPYPEARRILLEALEDAERKINAWFEKHKVEGSTSSNDSTVQMDVDQANEVLVNDPLLVRPRGIPIVRKCRWDAKRKKGKVCAEITGRINSAEGVKRKGQSVQAVGDEWPSQCSQDTFLASQTNLGSQNAANPYAHGANQVPGQYPSSVVTRPMVSGSSGQFYMCGSNGIGTSWKRLKAAKFDEKVSSRAQQKVN